MGKKYWVIINKTSIHIFFCLLMLLVMPHQLFAMPPSIARIVRIFEGRHKVAKKPNKPVTAVKDPSNALSDGDKAKDVSVKADENKLQSADSSMLSNAQQARLAIDEAIKDRKLVGHPATWYYRGVIYDRLLRDHIASEEASVLLNEAVASYEQTKKLSLPKSKQFHSFAVGNLVALWRYVLDRGMGYYRQEAVDRAIEQFAICRRILPEEPTPLLYTAIVYHSADQPEEALRYYQDYLTVQGPQFAVARAMAAIHYHKLKNFDKAITILNEALLQFPFNNELLEEKCLIYEASGTIDDYAASLAVAVQHKEIDACYAYAYLLEHQGRIWEAISYYQQVLKDRPNQYDALRQMGFLFYNEAIKLYADTLKLVGHKAQLKGPALADSCGLMQVTVRHLLPYATGLVEIDRSLSIWRYLLLRPFSASPTWVVYDHPLIKHSSKISSLGYLVQSGSLPYTSPLYGYIHTKNAAALACNQWAQTVIKLEKYLKESLYYLKIVRKQDKKDKAVAQALYYSYYHLKKYGSAYRLLQTMQKQYLEDDPFMGHEEKE